MKYTNPSFGKALAFILLMVHVCSFAQIGQYYGFTGGKYSISSGSTGTVKDGTNMISTDNHVYFVHSVNSKIHDAVWNTSTSTWSTSTGPLGGSGAQAVKSGTNIVNYGEEVFFVGATDSKIYRLKWTSGPGWQCTIVNPTQIAVTGNNIVLKTHPSGCEIYYIGGGKICMLYYDGITWGPGGVITATQTVNANANSSLVASDISLYYTGTTDNRIYRIYWGGSSWTGGNAPILPTSSPVRSGSKIITENNDLNHLYYVNTLNEVCELYKTGSTSFSWATLPMSSTTVRTATDIACSYGSVFYVSNSDSKVRRVWNPGSWTNELLSSIASPVAPSGQLHVWANDIIEETTLNTTFKSHHVFYPVTYISGFNRIGMLIYDDKRVTFAPFGCFDPCDANGNGSGLDLPSSPFSPIDPEQGYLCEQYNVGGIKAKEWYFGNIPVASGSGMKVTVPIARINKKFYYVNWDGFIRDFYRGTGNPISKPGYSTPWNDEFNDASVDPAKWNKNFPWGNHAHDVCSDIYWYEPDDVTEAGELINLGANNIPGSDINSVWIGGLTCGLQNTQYVYTQDYDYTGSMITTLDKVEFQYGYFESRYKLPRGKRFWPAFWLYYPAQDINIEHDGNGKVTLFTAFNPNSSLNQYSNYYAVGYRLYDDFYTFAIEWTSSYIKYYVNNELVTSFTNTGNNASNHHEIDFTMPIMDGLGYGACVPEIFPNKWEIDYVRVWGSDYRMQTALNGNAELSKPSFLVYPNPATNELKVAGEHFGKAEIFNLQGVKLLESTSTNINIEELANTIYVIKITDIGGRVQNLKFTKTR